MKKGLIVSILLILAAVGGFMWHLRQPPQQVNATVDQLFDTVAHQKIFSPDPEKVSDSLREIFADEVTIGEIAQFPGGTLSIDEVKSYLLTFHNFTSLCEFTEIEDSVAIIGDKAQAFRTTTVATAQGPDSRWEKTYKFTFDLEKSDRWRITAVRAKPVSQ